ncbi:ParB/RepB/Spo0J family partition protein [Phycicoccus sonneratiae]|uniref:ParB/RepB/Spo0J family partition protein n=1 Tax=Phycicoccus sonneratiae TaxID=2807628 RepID=A0ABS2CN49_9MICO|nr:ParB/RepB/Spo0J family partition protein [Phycicoccus sonneraticus]MBM6401258.1 ParB/RepB/Spo0J family partition protein [Phycicoccus sonneraticus]
MSEKRRALGRGLGALIPSQPATDRPVDVFFPARDATADTAAGTDADAATNPAPDDPTGGSAAAESDGLRPVPGARFAEIPLDEITPNRRQPRTVFDEDELAELVHSVREIGVLQPVVVRPVPGAGPDDTVRYELIMGERRWRASREAGKETVPAIVRSTDEDDLLRDALLENLHRSQLNPLEEAAAYQQLLDDFGCTQEELAGRIGRSRPQISNTLRLLRLPPLVARRVAAGVLSAGHARALLGLPDAAAMERMAQRIVAEGLSVRSVEELVALGDGDTPARRSKPRPGARRPQLDDLAADLSDRLETRVRIALGQKKGRLTVEFASVDDLNRILDVMKLRATADAE